MISAHVTKPSIALKAAVRLNVALLLVLGAIPVLAPGALLRGFGIANASFAVMGLVRVYAVFALLLAILLWGAQEWLQSPSGRFTAGALAAAYGLGALLLFTQQWALWDGRSGVALIVGCAMLALSYGVALGTSRTASAPVA